MNNFEFRFHHIGISVPNLESSIAWYHSVLGFRVERRLHIESIPAEVAVLRNGPLHVELFCSPVAAVLPEQRREPDQDILTHGNKHGAFAVDDAIAFAEELCRRGADVVVARRFPNGGAHCFVRDNAGNLLEFLQAMRCEEEVATL